MAEIFFSWEKLEKVGQGAFGEVWKVRTNTGSILAAKYIAGRSLGSHSVEESLSELDDEVRMLKTLSHQNVVKFVTVKKEGDKLVVFTEFIRGQDLASFGALNEYRARNFLKQICDGLNYLHSRNPPVLHRDLKGQNIMVTDAGIVKIIDFGLSMNLLAAYGKNASGVMMTANQCGTPPFMAPELFDEICRFSVKSDVWAFGMTLYQMLAGETPFLEARDIRNLKDIIINRGAPNLPADSTRLMKDFYARCTVQHPAGRASVRQLLQHELFRN